MPDAFDKLPDFIKGDPMDRAITADKLNAMVRAIRSLRPMSGPGTLIKTSPRGTVISSDATSYTDSSYPFDVVPVNSSTISLRPGSMNSLVPTNMTSNFTINPAAIQYVSLDCVASDGVFASSSISIKNSAPAFIGIRLGYPPNAFSVALHLLVYGASYRLIANSSLQAIAKEAFRVQKIMTTPDMLPYDSYYTWELSDV